MDSSQESRESFGVLPFASDLDIESVTAIMKNFESVADPISANYLFQRKNEYFKRLIEEKMVRAGAKRKITIEDNQEVNKSLSKKNLKGIGKRDAETLNLPGTSLTERSSVSNIPSKISKSSTSIEIAEEKIKVTPICDWHLKIQDSRLKLLGYLNTEKNSVGKKSKWYDAGFILARQDKDIVKTTNGLYKLLEKINFKKSTLGIDLSKYFKDGFPRCWRNVLKEALVETKSLNASKSSLFLKTLEEKYLKDEVSISDKPMNEKLSKPSHSSSSKSKSTVKFDPKKKEKNSVKCQPKKKEKNSVKCQPKKKEKSFNKIFTKKDTRKSPRFQKNVLKEINRNSCTSLLEESNSNTSLFSEDYINSENLLFKENLEEMVKTCMNSAKKVLPEMNNHATPTTRTMSCLVDGSSNHDPESDDSLQENAKQNRDVAKRVVKLSKGRNNAQKSISKSNKKEKSEVTKIVSELLKPAPVTSNIVQKMFRQVKDKESDDSDASVSEISEK